MEGSTLLRLQSNWYQSLLIVCVILPHLGGIVGQEYTNTTRQIKKWICFGKSDFLRALKAVNFRVTEFSLIQFSHVLLMEKSRHTMCFIFVAACIYGLARIATLQNWKGRKIQQLSLIQEHSISHNCVWHLYINAPITFQPFGRDT